MATRQNTIIVNIKILILIYIPVFFFAGCVSSEPPIQQVEVVEELENIENIKTTNNFLLLNITEQLVKTSTDGILNFEDVVNYPFLDKTEVRYLHLLNDSAVNNNSWVVKKQLLGHVVPWPEVLSEKNNQAIQEALVAYGVSDYQTAVEYLAPIYEMEKGNPFYLIIYAKTLFWSYSTYDKGLSYSFFRRSDELIDNNVRTSKNEIIVDLWFPDLYWKMAILNLDQAKYEEALFELSRTLICTTLDKQSPMYEQLVNYLTEAHYFLGNTELNRFLYDYTKELFPQNVYIDKFRL